MEEQTEENTIRLQEGIEYYAIIKFVSTKDSENIKVTVERGPPEYITDAQDDDLIEIPGSWRFVERLIAQISTNEETP